MMSYIKDKPAYAIEISELTLVNSVSLDFIRNKDVSFYPPQSFRYINENLLSLIVGI